MEHVAMMWIDDNENQTLLFFKRSTFQRIRNVCLTFVASPVGVSSVGVSLVGGVQPRGNMSSDGAQPEFHSLRLVKCLVRFND
jgi:hypothetical protein